LNNKKNKEAYIGSDIHHADAILALSHMTGHEAAGFGAAIKNIGMGCASRKGNLLCTVHPDRLSITTGALDVRAVCNGAR